MNMYIHIHIILRKRELPHRRGCGERHRVDAQQSNTEELLNTETQVSLDRSIYMCTYVCMYMFGGTSTRAYTHTVCIEICLFISAHGNESSATSSKLSWTASRRYVSVPKKNRGKEVSIHPCIYVYIHASIWKLTETRAATLSRWSWTASRRCASSRRPSRRCGVQLAGRCPRKKNINKDTWGVKWYKRKKTRWRSIKIKFNHITVDRLEDAALPRRCPCPRSVPCGAAGWPAAGGMVNGGVRLALAKSR